MKKWWLVMCLWLPAWAAHAEEERLVDKVGSTLRKGAEATGNGIEKAGEVTGKGLHKAADAVEGKLKKADDWIQEKVGTNKGESKPADK